MSSSYGMTVRRGLPSESRSNPEFGEAVIPLAYYANAGERGQVIAGLRALADFLEGHPDAPAPKWADVMVFPSGDTDADIRVATDSIAARIGATIADNTAAGGHYVASVKFGPVEYKIIAIPVDVRAGAVKGTR
jgi:hypothetical protein